MPLSCPSYGRIVSCINFCNFLSVLKLRHLLIDNNQISVRLQHILLHLHILLLRLLDNRLSPYFYLLIYHLIFLILKTIYTFLLHLNLLLQPSLCSLLLNKPLLLDLHLIQHILLAWFLFGFWWLESSEEIIVVVNKQLIYLDLLHSRNKSLNKKGMSTVW